MRFYLVTRAGERSFVTTQADAKAAAGQHGAWMPVEIATGKEGLLTVLNELVKPASEFAAVTAELPAALDIDAIEDAITEMNANQVARVVMAAFEQLTLAGQPALDAIKAFLARHAAHGLFDSAAHVITALALSEIATGKRIAS